jgi:protein TonB
MHIPWAFPLNEAPRLPLTGEDHPLKREFGRWLWWANGTAVLLGIAIFASWYVIRNLDRDKGPVERQVRIVRYTELGVPPSLATPKAPQVNVAEAVAQAVTPPSIGVPEPVPDEMAQSTTIATSAEMSEFLAPITMEDLGIEAGDPFVVELDVEVQPEPEEFVAVEEEPVRISIDPPVYPKAAQDADVEGTVLVRALVGKDGRVTECVILDGNAMLNDAAIACAKSAVFRPALLQHRPVEVWVIIPVTFKTH